MRGICVTTFLGILLIPFNILFANIDVDSLKTVIRTTSDKIDRGAALVDLAKHYQMRNNDSVYYYAEELWQMGTQLREPKFKMQSRLVLGMIHHNQGRLQEGRKWFHEARDIAQRAQLDTMLGSAYLDLGLSHSRGFNLDSAYYYFQQAEKKFEVNGEEDILWKCYLGYSTVNEKRQDYDAADKNLRKAIKILPAYAPSADRGFLLYRAFSYAAINRRYELMYDVRVMWNEYKGSRQFSLESLHRPEHFALFSLLTMNKIDIKQLLFDAGEYFTEMGSPYKLAAVYYDLGSLYEDEAQYQKAKQYYEQANNLYTEVGWSSYIVSIRSSLANIYRREGDYEQAYKYTVASHRLIDSLRNVESERNLKRYQVEFETEKKEQALRINQLELKQKTQERNIWLGSSVFLAILAVSIFSSTRQRMRQRELLTQQETAIQEEKIQRLEQEKRLLALSAMIDGQEQERRRIAKDLHDGMGGLLTTIKAHYNTIGDAISDDKYRQIVPQTGELIDRACTEVRRISQNMMPAALLYSGLEGAVEDLAVQVRTSGLECSLEMVGDLSMLDEARTVSIYRILQEAINNILKHAQASQVLLQLIVHGNELHITVEDNGKGFVYEEAYQQKSLGMKSLTSRVQYLKGTWDVDSVAGEGTALTFCLPLD